MDAMPQVLINAPAPDFSLADFNGQPVHLSDFREKSHVLLIFNRGFT
jgi:peroxiredoxin